MDSSRASLVQFRERLQDLMIDEKTRPFVCDGSPLTCSVFIVGFNPATEMDKSFWSYWSDTSGFDNAAFMRDYLLKRGLQEPKGVRARIERIVAQLPAGTCLETNICSKPTKTAAELQPRDRTTAIFRLLLGTIRPDFVYVHSNDPIAYFERLTGTTGFDNGSPRTVSVDGHSFKILGTRGPLFRMGFTAAEELGRLIGSARAA
jgi:hypothetical protein